MITLSISNLR